MDNVHPSSFGQAIPECNLTDSGLQSPDLRHSQGSFCNDIPNRSFDNARGTSLGQDELGTRIVQLEDSHDDHTQVVPLQPGLVRDNTERRLDSMEPLVNSRSSPSPAAVACNPGSQSLAAATAMQCRAVSDYLPLTKMPAVEGSTTLYEPPAAAPPLDYPDRTGSSGSSSSWSSKQDELLLHLRDVAQLDWHFVVRCFPNTPLNFVKHRHRQLSHPKASRSSTQTYVGQKCEKGISVSATTHRTPSRRRATTMAVQLTALHRGRTAKPRLDPKVVASCAPEHVVQRVSRRGRPIKHPFRHLPTEGYLQ